MEKKEDAYLHSYPCLKTDRTVKRIGSLSRYSLSSIPSDSFGDRRSPPPQPSASTPGASSTWVSGPGEADDGSGRFCVGIPAAGSARRAAFLPGGNEEEEDVPVRQLPFGRVTAEGAARRCLVHPPALAAGAGAQH